MRFSAEGNDMYICQICGRDLDSVKHPPTWRPDLTKRQSAGNVCPTCIEKLVQCKCKASTGICGCITYGTGKLDFNGFWEIPCPHGTEVHTCFGGKTNELQTSK